MHTLGIFAALLAVTAAAYYPAWDGSLLWDDAGHLTRPELRSPAGLVRIWFDLGATQQYYPVVHSAFWLQAWLWGDNTLGYHLVNIALHASSATLIWITLCQLNVRAAIMPALVFALHPVHVESVAWISELKNTLSGVWFLASLLAYITFDRTRDRRMYGMAWFAFVLALLSKTVTAMLPLAVLSVIWWRRGQLQWRRDVMPLTPFVTIAVPLGLLTMWVERTLIGASGAEFEMSFVERVLVAGRAACFYLWKIIWPVNLTFHYPRWSIDAAEIWQYAYPTALVLLVAGCWAVRRWSRAPLAALLFFLVTVAPASGLVSVYPFRFSFVADHFQDLASVGPISLVAAAAARMVLRAWPSARLLPVLVALLVTGAPLFVLTWRQSHDYRSEETLWRATLERNPDSWAARNALAALLVGSRPENAAEAALHARRAVDLEPRVPASHFNLGRALEELGDLEGAAAAFEQCIELLGEGEAGRPFRAMANRALARAMEALDRHDEAVKAYERALRYAPDSALALTDLGTALARMKRFDEAIDLLARATRADPQLPEAHANLGVALLEAGRLPEAVQSLSAALDLDPTLLDARHSRGLAHLQLEDYAEAALHFRAILEVDR